MSWITEQRIREILLELIEDNPFAIRALLRILDTRFTLKVPTLAVTCQERPRLLINLGFLNAHCANDDEVKAVICHEFLHVILRHTEQRRALTPQRHLAVDAVINAILHRQCGERYSAMMARYYGQAEGLARLLRPMNDAERADLQRRQDGLAPLPQWLAAWEALYAGRLVADDIEELAQTLGQGGGGAFRLVARVLGGGALLGDHDALDAPLGEEIEAALEEALRQMNGHGVWRAERLAGMGIEAYDAVFAARQEAMRRWERATLALLRRHVTPDRRSRAHRPVESAAHLPVLSPGDRRAFLRALWAPFLPQASWPAQRRQREGTAQVYLDVSGSMNLEMPAIVALLGRLSRHIRRPFWAFSNVVAPAVIEKGRLLAATTGGTSLTCVLRHIARTQPEAALIVTDGYVEQIAPRDVAAISGSRVHVVLARGGDPSALERAKLPYTRLAQVPA